MPKSYVYKPAPRWPTFAALVGALTIEFAALALAGRQDRQTLPIDPGFLPPTQPIEAEFIDLPPEPAPPEIPPPPIPPPPDVETDFILPESATPPEPARKRPLRKPGPRPALRSETSAASLLSAQASLTSAPRPEYPYEARRSRQTGSGRFVLQFDADGAVTNVSIEQSTGSLLLDHVCERTFRRWRCQPSTYRMICVPVTFTLLGAQL